MLLFFTPIKRKNIKIIIKTLMPTFFSDFDFG